MIIAAPKELRPQQRYVELAEENARVSGGTVRVTEDPVEAVTDADVVYADVWVSMGREADQADRLDLLAPYQVNANLVRHARGDFAFMHCLPAHIGQEVTGEVAYGPRSVMFDQAENRLHVQKALMEFLIESNEGGA
jgi:ornithine carbamoyltransferase